MSFSLSTDDIDDFGDNVVALEEARTDFWNLVSEHLLDSVQMVARSNPRWAGLADNIDVWDEGGRLVLGVNSSEFVSEAFAAEYGADEYPPNPLIRTSDGLMRNSLAYASSNMSARLGNT